MSRIKSSRKCALPMADAGGLHLAWQGNSRDQQPNSRHPISAPCTKHVQQGWPCAENRFMCAAGRWRNTDESRQDMRGSLSVRAANLSTTSNLSLFQGSGVDEMWCFLAQATNTASNARSCGRKCKLKLGQNSNLAKTGVVTPDRFGPLDVTSPPCKNASLPAPGFQETQGTPRC
jgi:hypothetical protein